MCAHLERHVFSLNRSFLWFYEEKDNSFWEKKLSEKKARLDKIGHFTNSVLMYHSKHSFTHREKKRESIENDDQLLEVGCDRMFVV